MVRTDEEKDGWKGVERNCAESKTRKRVVGEVESAPCYAERDGGKGVGRGG